MGGFLLAPHGRGEAFARGFGEKLGAPRVKRRLQPDLQLHSQRIGRRRAAALD
jgi:hypothetical protein